MQNKEFKLKTTHSALATDAWVMNSPLPPLVRLGSKKKATNMVHNNSIISYEEMTPKLSGRRKDVYQVIHRSGKKMTDREVKETLGVSDMNYVRPRITELLKLGHIVEVDDIKCHLTNKKVRRVATIHNVNNALDCFEMHNKGGQNDG